MRSPVMGSPFWLLKAFPRAVMMFAGFCGAGDSDAFVAIPCLLCCVESQSNQPEGSGTTYVRTSFYIQETSL